MLSIVTQDAFLKHAIIGCIASTKVEGVSVFGSDGEKLGTIARLMIDKLSGRVV